MRKLCTNINKTLENQLDTGIQLKCWHAIDAQFVFVRWNSQSQTCVNKAINYPGKAP